MRPFGWVPAPEVRFQSAEMALFKAIGGPFCDDLVVIPLATLPSGRDRREHPARTTPTPAHSHRPGYFLSPSSRYLFGAGALLSLRHLALCALPRHFRGTRCRPLVLLPLGPRTLSLLVPVRASAHKLSKVSSD